MSCFECKKSTESSNLFICSHHLPTEDGGKLGYPISPQIIFCSRCLLSKHWDCHREGNAIKPRSLLEYMNENAVVELEEELEKSEQGVQQMISQFQHLQNMLKQRRVLFIENKTAFDCTKTNLIDVNFSLTNINCQLQDTLEICETQDNATKPKPIIAEHHSQVEEPLKPQPVEQEEEGEPISLRPRFWAPQAAHVLEAEPTPNPKKTFSPLRIMREMKLREQAAAEMLKVSSPDKEPRIIKEMLAFGETKEFDDEEPIQEGWKTIICEPPSTGLATERVGRNVDALPFVSAGQRPQVDELYERALSGGGSDDGWGSGAQSKPRQGTIVEMSRGPFAGAPMGDQMKLSWVPGSNTGELKQGGFKQDTS
ncbi:unnamed protein product, partial [Mesorhabditis belari]|uniref:Uncharacterized protein n=1 Tax=Mesorhabditis belari TaxID=2138241 RepID=A0AAF3EWA3_9BILA